MNKEEKILEKFLKSNNFGCLPGCAACSCNRLLSEYKPRSKKI